MPSTENRVAIEFFKSKIIDNQGLNYEVKLVDRPKHVAWAYTICKNGTPYVQVSKLSNKGSEIHLLFLQEKYAVVVKHQQTVLLHKYVFAYKGEQYTAKANTLSGYELYKENTRIAT